MKDLKTEVRKVIMWVQVGGLDSREKSRSNDKMCSYGPKKRSTPHIGQYCKVNSDNRKTGHVCTVVRNSLHLDFKVDYLPDD